MNGIGSHAGERIIPGLEVRLAPANGSCQLMRSEDCDVGQLMEGIGVVKAEVELGRPPTAEVVTTWLDCCCILLPDIIPLMATDVIEAGGGRTPRPMKRNQRWHHGHMVEKSMAISGSQKPK